MICASESHPKRGDLRCRNCACQEHNPELVLVATRYQLVTLDLRAAVDRVIL